MIPIFDFQCRECSETASTRDLFRQNSDGAFSCSKCAVTRKTPKTSVGAIPLIPGNGGVEDSVYVDPPHGKPDLQAPPKPSKYRYTSESPCVHCGRYVSLSPSYGPAGSPLEHPDCRRAVDKGLPVQCGPGSEVAQVLDALEARVKDLWQVAREADRATGEAREAYRSACNAISVTPLL